jgi:hypothetical protein
MSASFLGVRLLRWGEGSPQVVGDAVVESSNGGGRPSAQRGKSERNRAADAGRLSRLSRSGIGRESALSRFSLTIVRDFECVQRPGMHDRLRFVVV